MDCSPSGSSVHGILQARILEWVAISSSRDQTCISCVSCIGHRFFPGQGLFIPLEGSVTERAPSLLGSRGAWLVWQIKFSTLYLHTVRSSFSPRRERVVRIKLGSPTSRIECLMIWFNIRRKKRVHNKWNEFTSPPNQSPFPSLRKTCLSWNQSLVTKRLGTTGIKHLSSHSPWEPPEKRVFP